MPDEGHDQLRAARAAVERYAAGGDGELPRGDGGSLAGDEAGVARSVSDRWLGSVLATVLGGLALAALGGIAGVLSLGVAAIVLGLLVAGAAVAGLVRLSEREARREASADTSLDSTSKQDQEARAALVAAVDGVLTHVERLDGERAALHEKVERLERRLAAKERKLARVQAFDAERRTLEPAPPEPMAGQLTFDAVAE